MAKDIKYLNRDFDSFKTDLKNFAKNYFPNSHKDFSDASTAQMLLELMAYTGDVLSYYQDQQMRELLVDDAVETKNILGLAKTLGAKVRGAGNAVAELSLSCRVSASIGDTYTPDYLQAPSLLQGSTFVADNTVNSVFETIEDANLFMSSSLITASVYSRDQAGDPNYWTLTTKVKAISGNVKTYEYTVGDWEKYLDITINADNMVGIESVYDSQGYRWYEVDYLAQDSILKDYPNDGNWGTLLESDKRTIPSILTYEKVDRRFTTYFDDEGNLHLQFGAGNPVLVDEESIPNPASLGVPGILYNSQIRQVDPSALLTSNVLGIAPSNTTLTIKYRISNGINDNVSAGKISRISNLSYDFRYSGLGTAKKDEIIASVTVTNEYPAYGGSAMMSLEEIKQTIKASFGSQLRAVTSEDIVARCKQMPGNFGTVAKAYVKIGDLRHKKRITGGSGYVTPTNIAAVISSTTSTEPITVE